MSSWVRFLIALGRCVALMDVFRPVLLVCLPAATYICGCLFGIAISRFDLLKPLALDLLFECAEVFADCGFGFRVMTQGLEDFRQDVGCGLFLIEDFRLGLSRVCAFAPRRLGGLRV